MGTGHDGSIFPNPGYDPATGTLYKPSVKLATIPEKPTKKDAVDAAGRLFDLVDDFPFADAGVDGSVWLAAALDPHSSGRRSLLGPVPGVRIQWEQGRYGQGALGRLDWS